MPPVLAIVGRANVGKSTLFNRLTRSRGALVDDRPGITRDRLYATLTFEGIPLTLVDTAGFDDLTMDPLADKVRAQVEMAIEDADRILFLVDGRQGALPGDEAIAEMLRRTDKRVFLAVNKVDGPEQEGLAADFHGLGFSPLYTLSGAHGYGVRDLMEAVVADLPQEGPEPLEEERIRVAVLGRPNVGKSSLINRILGEERLVVSERPGTTRDAVDVLFTWNARDMLLIDTAGIRRKSKVREKIDKFSMLKALKGLARCQVALVVIDASEGVAEQDARICSYAEDLGKGMVLALNKWDLLKGDRDKQRDLEAALDRDLPFLAHVPRIKVSALTGERTGRLLDTIPRVYDQCSARVGTPAVNKALEEILERNPAPALGKGRLKVFYATQVGICPPTFTLFVNRPDLIQPPYKRFLVHGLREALNLPHAPIRLRFKKRERR